MEQEWMEEQAEDHDVGIQAVWAAESETSRVIVLNNHVVTPISAARMVEWNGGKPWM